VSCLVLGKALSEGPFRRAFNFASGRPLLRRACRATCVAPLGRRDDAMWGEAHRDRRVLPLEPGVSAWPRGGASKNEKKGWLYSILSSGIRSWATGGDAREFRAPAGGAGSQARLHRTMIASLKILRFFRYACGQQFLSRQQHVAVWSHRM